MRIRVVDLETTGLEPPEKVVEIGAWDLDGDCIRQVDFPHLVNPCQPIPPRMSAIHHIIDADVCDKPSWPEAADGMLIGGFDAFAAHNAGFERKWITDDLTGGKPWICTYRCALRVWPEAPGHGNQELRYWLKPEGLDREIAAVAHRAGPDAYVTAFTLRELLHRASFDELVAWSAEPALLPRIPFGKHRGAAWNSVPRDYLDWICRQTDMSEDIRFTAQQTLKQGAKS
jgi:exodeoxyribonuclease X